MPVWTQWRAPARRRSSARLVAVGAIALGALGLPAGAHAAVRTATPASFAGVLEAAGGGDVVKLATGRYGTFTVTARTGAVTLAAQSGAAPSVELNLNSAHDVRLDRLSIRSLTISGASRNITISNSTFTGMAVVRSDAMVNANIVFDNNTHAGIDVCGNCYEGRLQVVGQGSGPVGVTVRNSTFGPGGDADGMQVGAAGVQILQNEFVGLRQVSATHTDSLQLYGASNTTIRGNYFHDSDVSIMAPDGGRNEQITDNVFVAGGNYRPAVQLGSHRGTQFVHNTVKNMDVHMDRKSENPGNPSRDGVIRDNVFVNGRIGGFSTDPSYCSNCTFSYNLFSSGRGEGSNSLIGTARFVGGANPSTWAGFALASGSPGKGNASDGRDRGIRLGAGPGAPPPAAPGAGAPAEAQGRARSDQGAQADLAQAAEARPAGPRDRARAGQGRVDAEAQGRPARARAQVPRGPGRHAHVRAPPAAEAPRRGTRGRFACGCG